MNTGMESKTLAEILQQRSYLDDVGITFIEKSDLEEFLSYRQLHQLALKALALLQSRGIQPKQEVVIQASDNKNFIIAFWACILGGIIPVPLSLGRSDDQKQKLFKVWQVLNNPHLIIARPEFERLAVFAGGGGHDQIYAQMGSYIDETELVSFAGEGRPFCAGENDIAFIQFSSGSTGLPKGVMLTHRNLLANIAAISRASAYTAGDSMISWMPLTHDMGLIGFHINPLFNRMPQYLMPVDLFIRRPALWLDNISHHRVSILCSPNFGYEYVLRHVDFSKGHHWDLSHVRIIYNGAEPISDKICYNFLRHLANYGLNSYAMCPVYGLAEASLAVAISGLEEDVISLSLDRSKVGLGDRVKVMASGENLISFVNVGKPVQDCTVRITNDNNIPVENEIIGHIQIKGENVTAGYYNNPAVTADVVTGDGWLATGDIGFLKDGSLYITGRRKDIIFINGQNYYAHDLERLAEELDGIELNKIVVAGFSNDGTGMEEVAAFILHRDRLERFVPLATALKAFINSKTGIEISRIIPVKDIPRTTSGKLQRFRLVEKLKRGDFREAELELCGLMNEAGSDASGITRAENDTEQMLLEIWKQVLQLDTIGITQDFFEIGGDSLKAMQVEMCLLSVFQVELPAGALYEKKTIKELAKEIAKQEEHCYAAIPLIPVNEYYPVSVLQRRIYYSWALNRTATAYNIPVALSIKGKLHAEKLQDCIKQLIIRHDSLRMSFHMVNEPVFTIQEHIDFTLNCAACSRNELDEWLRHAARPFDLTKGPLFSITLLTVDGKEQILFMNFHHIIADGVSIYHFIDELRELYAGNGLASLPVQYKDYVGWEAGKRTSAELTRQKEYWLNRLEGELPVLEMPVDFERPSLFHMEGQKASFEIDPQTSRQLRQLAATKKCTLHVLMFTLYNILLSKYTGQEDIIVGIPVAGRRHPDLQQVFGMFVNNLAIRNVIEGPATFTAFLAAVNRNMIDGLNNQDYAFDDLIRIMDRKADVSRNPLFDTMFLYQNMKFRTEESTGFGFSRYFFDPGFAKFDISMEVFEDEDSIQYNIEYATKLFRRGTILRLARHFENLINNVINNPDSKLEDLTLISDVKYNEYIRRFNATESDYPKHKTIHQLFQEQALKTPESTAVEYNGSSITYRQLLAEAERMAALLRERGIAENSVAAVLLKRSPQLIISILGVLMAGGCYLPVDPDMPESRKHFLIENSRCSIIITGNDTPYTSQPDHTNKPGIINVDAPDLQKYQAPEAVDGGAPHTLAYIIYTSGTTGDPKGVMITHQSLVNYITWASRNYIQGEPADFPLYTSISFDLTITSVFTPLITGNKIIIYEENGKDLLIEQVISDNKAEVIKLTPSHLKIIREIKVNTSTGKSRLKRLIVGGETLDTRLTKEIYDNWGGKIEIYNEYGPTEATVGCMIHKFDPGEHRRSVPIGIPAANTRIYLLDKYLKPVPTGVDGEIFISGDGIAEGYLFNEALTARKFMMDPFIKGEKMYRTGDMARRHPDGEIEFIGRADRQVKINGYRIELGEIEHTMLTHPNIAEALVVLGKQAADQRTLCAYYKTRRKWEDDMERSSLRNYLRGRLPADMIPIHFMEFEKIPLTRNGKIDYDALPLWKPNETVRKRILPGNETEQLMSEIWQSMLGTGTLSVMDNFFELGGDSIKAVQIVSRLLDRGITLSAKDILTHQTIREISPYAKTVNADSKYGQDMIRGEKHLAPIEAWFLSRNFENCNYYNQSILLRFKRKIDRPLLQASLEKLIKHHDGLRLNYNPRNHTLFYNEKHYGKAFYVEEHTVEGDPDPTAAMIRVCSALKAGFDITGSLLLKAAVIKTAADADMLFVTAHHLVMDGVSWRILLEDLYNIYTALEREEEISLSAKTANLLDWERAFIEYAASEALKSEERYWKEIEDIEFHIPQDLMIHEWKVADVRKISRALSREKTSLLLKEAHKAYKADVNVLLNVALALTLKEWTGTNLFIIEQEGHGRYWTDVDASRTVGWFTTMYPLKLVLRHEDTGAQIEEVKEQMKRTPQQGIGYGIYKYFRKLPYREENRLTEVRFNYLGQFGKELNNDLFAYTSQSTGSDIFPGNSMTAKLDINVAVIEDVLNLDINYNASAHRDDTISWLVNTFFNNLDRILDPVNERSDAHLAPTDFDAVDLSDEEWNALFS